MLETKIILFLETAERGSLTQAAAHLEIDRPKAQRMLDELEKELKVQLFHSSSTRPKTHVRLSRMGEKFYHGCKQIQEMASNLREEMDFIPVPKITIGFCGTRDNQGLMELTSHYKKQMPEVTFVYRKNSIEGCLEDLYEGQSDVCFGLQNMFDALGSTKGLQATALFDYVVCAILPKTHPLAAREKFLAQELETENLIWLGRQYEESFYWNPLAVCSLPVGPSPFCKEVHSFEELLSSVQEEEGIGLVSRMQTNVEAVEKAGLKTSCFSCPYCIWAGENETRKEILDFIQTARTFYQTAHKQPGPSADPIQSDPEASF